MTKRFKINPDFTCPELAGYKLESFSIGQEDDVEKLSISAFPLNEKTSWGRGYSYDNERKRTGFIAGYHKAREKFEFTESDLRRALSMAFIAVQDGGNITSDEIIASFRTPCLPVAIEVEMEVTNTPGFARGKFPATNPDGTVKVVKWIFNE